MKFSYNNLITLSLNSNVSEKLLAYMKNYHFKVESGGIIVGKLNPSDNQIIVTDITEPQRKDKCSAFTYKRAEYAHQKIMDKLWKESQHTKTYIGEWHTHNQPIPQPSFVDIKNWIKISMRKQNSNWLFFIIVGTEQIGIWTIASGEILQMTITNI